MATSSKVESYIPPTDRRLRIRTFGGLSVFSRDGNAIPEATALRRPAAVLVAVAVAGERGITRDKLLGLLWPDAQPERASHSLTQAIYAVRRVTAVDDLFLTTGALRLNRARVSSDIDDFERALDGGDLERLVGMYEGAFLDGFVLSDSVDFDQWASAQRTRFEDRVVSALQELAGRATRAGDHRGAIEWHRRLAALRPLDSTAAAAMVTALAHVGDRAGALHRALDHAAALREQLELEPDPAFAKIIDTLRGPLPSALRIELPVSVASRPAGIVTDTGSSGERLDHTPSRHSPARSPWKLTRMGVRARRAWIPIGAAAALIASIVTVRELLPRPVESPAAAAVPRLFIAPFNAAGASPAVAYLGRGVTQLLTDRFAGDVHQRLIDGGVVSASWRRAGFDKVRDLPRDSILRVAKTEGADRVIVGSIVGGRARAVVSATLLTIDGNVLGVAATEGAADSISRMATRLVAKLAVAQAGEDSLIARWDTPLPALRVFLEGRAAYRRGSYTAAAQAFERALRLDSTFALAALQLARAADRVGDVDAEDAALARAWPYRAALSAHDRAQFVALAGPNYPEPASRSAQLAAWMGVVRTSPNRPGSWYELGTRLIHDGRRLGGEDARAQAVVALNRALVLDPGYQPARDLLAHIALRAGDRSVGAVSPSISDSSSAFAPFLQWRAAAERADSATLKEVEIRFPSMTRENLRAVAMASQFDAVGLRGGARAIQLLDERAMDSEQRVDAVLAAHSLALNLGRSADAIAQTTRLRRLRPESHAYLRLRVLDALYGGGDTAIANNAARELAAPVDSMFREFPLMKSRAAADACVLAQWRLARHDTSEVRAIVALLRVPDMRRDDQPVSAAPHACADLVEASLAVALKQSDALARIDRLDDLVLTSAVAGNVSVYASVAVSRMYAALGHPRRALVALRKRAYMEGWPAYLATTWRDESRLARIVGDVRRAAVSQQRYVALQTVATTGSATTREP
jgi:DNA-binding SARP family transcriptional activator